ncbi:hypothetical protein JO08_004261 [Salmonella enterica subsp. enterica]|jgi:hypothetical protein|uniref:hypothetical protein n=3 Tax=Escherichia coli TaxID=562 RepID=UPI00133172EA|nr:hypothetical protein [Escherichia coli]EDV1895773.1 hypothetical protein [Salmonella enterica subsp. enterica]
MESKQTSDQLCTMAHVEKPLAEKHLPTVLPQLPLNPRFRCSFCSRSIRYIYFFFNECSLEASANADQTYQENGHPGSRAKNHH